MRLLKKHIVFCLLLCLAIFASGQNKKTIQLTMWTTGQASMWDGQSIRYYGFGEGFLMPSTFPGPTIEAEEGDTLVVKVRNQSQGAPHTIHWHGLDVDQENDGVPQTSFSIYHTQDTQYTFVAPHPGTYLYHCHVASVIHVQMGMYGNVIIRPKGSGKFAWTGGPYYHQEKNWLISEFDKSWHDTIPVHNTGDSVHANFSVPDYDPDYFMINGKSHQQLSDSSTEINGMKFERIYLRLSNVGFLANRIDFPSSLNAEIISSDGRPLPASFPSDSLEIMPGERYGVILQSTTDLIDSISVSYINMNNGQLKDQQKVAVNISGLIDRKGQKDALELTAFPNPASEELWIRVNDDHNEKMMARLFDLSGKLVKTKFLETGLKKLSLQGIHPGLYLLEVESDGRFVRKKILVN